MMTGKLFSKKKLVFIALVLSTRAFGATTVENNLFAAVEGLTKKLAVASAQFVADKDLFAGLKGDVAALVPKFDVRDSERRAAWDCIQAEYNALVKLVEDCEANKAAVAAQGEVDVRDLTNQIVIVRNSTDKQIADLTVNIETVSAQIAQLKVDLATLTSLSGEAVTKALTDLASARLLYANMLVERQELVDSLNSLVVRVNAYNNISDSETAAAKLHVCGPDEEVAS